MSNKYYETTSAAFDAALDELAAAAKDGNRLRLLQARGALRELAPTLAATFDEHVRIGLCHLKQRWVEGKLTTSEFQTKLTQMLDAGRAHRGSLSDFETAFPHLNFARGQMDDIVYASFDTERLWRQFKAIVALKNIEGI